jgi:hypothetical protein
VVTLILSWAVINTVYTLRYAHLEFAAPDAGIAITEPPGAIPATVTSRTSRPRSA